MLLYYTGAKYNKRVVFLAMSKLESLRDARRLIARVGLLRPYHLRAALLPTLLRRYGIRERILKGLDRWTGVGWHRVIC